MVKEKGITCFFINIFNTFVMNWNELNELGCELLNDLEEAFSDYGFIDVEEDGIYTESDSEAMYQVSISWDYGEMDDVDDDDHEADHEGGRPEGEAALTGDAERQRVPRVRSGASGLDADEVGEAVERERGTAEENPQQIPFDVLFPCSHFCLPCEVSLLHSDKAVVTFI